MHPRIPELIAPPGAFMLGYGRREAALFLAIHVAFGAIVASAIDLDASNRRPLNRPETP